MEPITIKARLNQAYHFSGGSRKRHPFFRSFRRPGFRFPRGHIGCTQPFCPCRRAHQLRVPRPSDAGCAAVPPLSLCRIRKRHFNDCGDAVQEPESASLHRGISCFLRIRPHTGFPRRIPLSATTVFICPQSIFRNIFRFCVRTTAFFSYEPDRGG